MNVIGITVTAEVLQRGMNLFFKLPPSLRGKSLRGLGGNYDGNRANDIPGVDDVNAFVNNSRYFEHVGYV